MDGGIVKGVYLGEEIEIKTANKVGLLADIALIMANNGINIDAAMGYEEEGKATIFLITNGNLCVMDELAKLGYEAIREEEVLLVDLRNKPGALKLVTMELKNSGIDIHHLYVTSSTSGDSSKMVLRTNDNEKAMSHLLRYCGKE